MYSGWGLFSWVTCMTTVPASYSFTSGSPAPNLHCLNVGGAVCSRCSHTKQNTSRYGKKSEVCREVCAWFVHVVCSSQSYGLWGWTGILTNDPQCMRSVNCMGCIQSLIGINLFSLLAVPRTVLGWLWLVLQCAGCKQIRSTSQEIMK